MIRTSPPIFAMLALSVVALSSLACALCGGQTIEPAPLPADQQAILQRRLVGTWQHTHTIEEAGERVPATKEQLTWTFRENGSVTVQQVSAYAGIAGGSWKLEGRNIILTASSGNGKLAYRAEKWDEEEMIWFDYAKQETLVVTRLVEEDNPITNTSWSSPMW